MKISCMIDDYYHPGDLVKEGLTFLASEHQIEYVNPDNSDTPFPLAHYEAIILAKANMTVADKEKTWITPQWEEAIYRYIDNGGTLLVLHSGVVGYEIHNRMREIMGGFFSHHPEQCKVTYSPEGNSLYSRGFTSFTSVDEHYFVETDSDLNVFLTSTSIHGTQPAGWIKTHGEGKVITLTPGHTKEVWHNSNFQTSIKNALQR